MASKVPGPDGASARPVRILLVVVCLLALVLASGLVPALSGGVTDSPAGSLLPGDPLAGGSAQGNLDGNLGGLGSAFGALDPGRSTEVGGNTGVDGENAFQSQSNAVHFTVTSPQPAYWRTGAYDRYTGTGWAQTGSARPLDGSIDGEGIQGPRIEYEITLNRTATALPTVWRPTSIVGRSDLSVTDQRAIRAQEPLGPGDTYVGVSHRPPRDPSVLETAGRDYPQSVVDRYATLPDDVPNRVELFTNELTSDAATPYQTAVTIEQWLESDKTYSLQASRTSGNMADTFIFEMDRGYCEYFATSMVVMLRSQDIPARYVVGYSTGQGSGNSYTVRAMNAHAWVEVYFEDVGWVKFDPTPGSARLQQEQQSIQEQNPDADYSPREEGSPGETFTADEENTSQTATPTPTPTATPDDDSDGDTTTDSGYDIALNRTAVPGATVEVRVSRDGEPAAGVTVLFNGAPVGETDQDGTVVTEIPYTSELRVDVDDGTAASLAPPGAVPGGDDRFYSVPPPTRQSEVTVPVETDATVTVSGDPVPGGTVTVTATVQDVAVTDAPVTVAGERVATTDDSGRATVTLPDSTGNVTIAVARDPIRGETTVTLPALELRVEPTLPLAVPLSSATVEVTADGEPVSSAPITVGGRQVGTTDINGTAAVQLPLASSATVQVRAVGQTATATVSGLFVNLALSVLAIALVVAIPLAVAARRGYSPRDVARLLARLPGRAVQYGQWFLVALATRGGDLLRRLAARGRQTAWYLVDLLRGKVSPAALWAALLAWLAARRTELQRHRPGDASTDGKQSAPTPSEARRTVQAAWDELLSSVSLRQHRTKTPGEVARHAVRRDGLPEQPVRVLRDTFREVEYGARSATDRLDRVEEALTAIEQRRAAGDDDREGGD